MDRNDRWLAGLKGTLVALRKESVDRNSAVMRQNPGKHCRSPQGERG